MGQVENFFPEELVALKQAHFDAQEVHYQAHKAKTGLPADASINERIAADVAYQRTLNAAVAAQIAYDRALNAYLSHDPLEAA